MNQFLRSAFLMTFALVCFMTVVVILNGELHPSSPFTGCFGQIDFLERYVFGSIDDLAKSIDSHTFLYVLCEISIVIYGVFFSQERIVNIQPIIRKLKFLKS